MILRPLKNLTMEIGMRSKDKIPMKRFILLTILCLSTFMQSGCVLVPFIRAFKEVGATEGDRMALLNDEVRKFNAAVVWGDKTEAMSFITPESQLRLSSQFKDSSEEERVVDAKVENVTWADGAREATVVVKFKYFKIPVYVVNTRVEEQKWAFSHGDGWKILDRTVNEG